VGVGFQAPSNPAGGGITALADCETVVPAQPLLFNAGRASGAGPHQLRDSRLLGLAKVVAAGKPRPRFLVVSIACGQKVFAAHRDPKPPDRGSPLGGLSGLHLDQPILHSGEGGFSSSRFRRCGSASPIQLVSVAQ